MGTNQFKDFCPTDTGTNLTALGDYTADTDRTSGQKPGVAKSALNNRALRQANAVTSQFAQFLADKTGADINDDANTARLLAQINAAILPLADEVVRYTSGSGTHNATFIFFIATGSATVGATYTNNGVTYTVKETVASGVRIKMTGNGAPTASGTLTKASGTGDTTLTFYAMRAPLQVLVKQVAGGGGGGGGGASGGTAGGTGGTTSFGTSLITSTGGTGGSLGGGPGAGGTNTINSPAIAVLNVQGSSGQGAWLGVTGQNSGGQGGSSFMGGQGGGSVGNNGGGPAMANTGGGGGGGGAGSGQSSGSGGNGGGYAEAIIPITSTYSWAYTVGAAGTAGSGPANAGGAGGSGVISVIEKYQ